MPIFGKEWASGVVSEGAGATFSHIRKISNSALDLIDVEGNVIHFTAYAAGNGWIAELGGEGPTLTVSLTGEFKINTDFGSVHTFTKRSAQADTWHLSAVLREGNVNSGVRVVSEDVTVDGETTVRAKRITAPTAAVSPAVCETNPAVLHTDEYGNPCTGQNPSRYGWLGAAQRSAETLSGIALMGARLHDPATGRFLSIDPVPNGRAAGVRPAALPDRPGRGRAGDRPPA
ncbi:hypothetical protein [Yinghuangia sp. YIM S09857]|uniref:hypothetical protein n=1 Tax=Yinghuangia sp. YIM S09857 TaxID=3436929 RepID=UPI003F52AD90